MGKPFNTFDFDDAANAVQVKFELVDMCPYFASLDFRNYSLIDSVFTGQSSLSAAWASFQFLFNFPYLLISQLRDSVIFAAWRQTDFKGMFRVPRESYILQITDSVVGFYSVNVIDVVACWFWSNEGSHDQRLNRISSRLTRQTKYSVVVAVCTFYWFYYLTGPCAAGSKIASNSTETGDRVNPGEPSNNGSPLFNFKFFSAKFVDRHGMNLLLRFVSSLGWGGVRPSLQPL